MRLTSEREKNFAYFCQWKFLGDESLRYLAAQMRTARKTRCLVHFMPSHQLGPKWTIQGKTYQLRRWEAWCGDAQGRGG